MRSPGSTITFESSLATAFSQSILSCIVIVKTGPPPEPVRGWSRSTIRAVITFVSLAIGLGRWSGDAATTPMPGMYTADSPVGGKGSDRLPGKRKAVR